MLYYNQISKGYNELHKEEQFKKLNIINKHLKVKKTDKLLDVGCGTGISSDFDCKVTGIDPSKELLKQNKGKTILGKAENLPFKDNSFDIVIAVTSIHNFDDIENGLKEIKRVGKDKFIFSILKRSKKFNEINSLLNKHFKVNKAIEEEKDIIFFCV
ncbi:MAG: methyltransferase domain-containing protein [Candidatus Woesearchaeota archaeon]